MHHLYDPEVEEEIADSLDYVKKNYRKDGKAKSSYLELMRLRKELDVSSESYLKKLYLTLIDWGMDARGAKLAQEEIFIESVQSHSDSFKKLVNFKIESVTSSEFENSLAILGELFRHLELVATSKPPLVTFAKTMHFLVPELLVPMDRTYTMCFFFGSTTLNYKMHRFDTYAALFREFYDFSHNHPELKGYLDDDWNYSVPKIMDSIIIGYLNRNSLNCNKKKR